MLVMKFGGTSVGSAERIRAAAELIRDARRDRDVLVVVSAMARVTDLLLDTMKHAEADDRGVVEQNIAQLRQRHLQAAHELRADPDAIESLIREFERIVNGMLMLGERPARSVDEAVAIGERLSSVLVAAPPQCDGHACRGLQRR